MMSNFKFGMNIHRSGNPVKSYTLANLEENIDLCSELGMEIVRYNNTCRSEAAFEEVKKVSALCRAKGMKLMHVIDTHIYTEMDSLEEIESKMADYYRNISSVLRDKVDYYQIYNEIDVTCMRGTIANIFLTPKDGKEKGEYDCVLWEKSVAAFKGAFRGIKEGFPEAKTCINFAWWHTALIYELYELGLRWDITGLDWYSDCEEVSSIEKLMNNVLEQIPDTEFMICETNYWMNLHPRYTEDQKAALKNRESRNKGQAEWIPEFIDTLVRINNPRLKAVIFYELLDEPSNERNGEYCGEAHFGFVECDINGENRIRKPAFYALKEKIKEIK